MELCRFNKKISVLLKDDGGKAFFYGKVETKPILFAYATNPFVYYFEKVIHIIEEEIVKILEKAYITKELIKIHSIENKCDTIIITIQNKKEGKRGSKSSIKRFFTIANSFLRFLYPGPSR